MASSLKNHRWGGMLLKSSQIKLLNPTPARWRSRPCPRRILDDGLISQDGLSSRACHVRQDGHISRACHAQLRRCPAVLQLAWLRFGLEESSDLTKKTMQSRSGSLRSHAQCQSLLDALCCCVARAALLCFCSLISIPVPWRKISPAHVRRRPV